MNKAQSLRKSGLVVKIVISILSLMFAAVVYVWITSFGGEFLIIARYSWILIVFAALLVLSSLFGITASLKGKAPTVSKAVRVASAIWNLLSGVMLLFVFSKLFMWVVDTMELPELLALSPAFCRFRGVADPGRRSGGL